MRQPKFLRHLVEKFLLKGSEGNASIYPGILPIWDTQPIGVTRLPISVMKIDSYDRDNEVDVSGELTEPKVWTRETTQAANAIVDFAVGIPARTIIQVSSLVTASLVPTSAVAINLYLVLAGTDTPVWAQTAFFGIGMLGPIEFKSPFVIFDRPLDAAIEVSGIDPVGQNIRFSSEICLFPNRE